MSNQSIEQQYGEGEEGGEGEERSMAKREEMEKGERNLGQIGESVTHPSTNCFQKTSDATSQNLSNLIWLDLFQRTAVRNKKAQES